MTQLPIAGPSQHAVYTGRSTSWPMVAATSAGALLVVLMGRIQRRLGRPLFRRAVDPRCDRRARQRPDSFQRVPEPAAAVAALREASAGGQPGGA